MITQSMLMDLSREHKLVLYAALSNPILRMLVDNQCAETQKALLDLNAEDPMFIVQFKGLQTELRILKEFQTTTGELSDEIASNSPATHLMLSQEQ